jgi:acetolactate synthase-1/2/3 large subunit
MMTTGEAVIEALVRAGIDTLYALPGVHNDALFDAAQRSAGRVRIIHPRHEQAAGYMALGAALATGRPQAFAVVPGPGLLNAGAALLTAHAMGAPVLALVGQIPSFAIDHGFGHLHELPDQLGLMRHLTKFAARVDAPFQAPGLVDAALGAAVSGKPGAVALECAIDTWGASGPVEMGVQTPPAPPPPLDADAIARAAAILDGARRPIIVAGGGAIGAEAPLRALAERLQAPVCTFRRGRGVLPTTHPLAVSYPEAHRLWREADAVLAVGTRLHWPLTWWGVDDALPVIRVDIDPSVHDRIRPPAVALTGDAAPVLAALIAALAPDPHPSRADEIAEHRAWFDARLARQEPQMGLLRAIRAALPEDGIFIEDVTQLGFVARLAFPVTMPRTYLSPGYQDNLGWAYGTALGAQAACPERCVVAVAGDGGFMYQAGELATAMRHGLPVVVVVVDDGAFGNVRRIQEQAYGNRLIACDLHNPDFCRLAESFGMRAWRAATPEALEAALREAFAARRPGLVHVPAGAMPSPWDMILLPRVRGFEESWRRRLP